MAFWELALNKQDVHYIMPPEKFKYTSTIFSISVQINSSFYKSLVNFIEHFVKKKTFVHSLLLHGCKTDHL